MTPNNNNNNNNMNEGLVPEPPDLETGTTVASEKSSDSSPGDNNNNVVAIGVVEDESERSGGSTENVTASSDSSDLDEEEDQEMGDLREKDKKVSQEQNSSEAVEETPKALAAKASTEADVAASTTGEAPGSIAEEQAPAVRKEEEEESIKEEEAKVLTSTKEQDNTTDELTAEVMTAACKPLSKPSSSPPLPAYLKNMDDRVDRKLRADQQEKDVAAAKRQQQATDADLKKKLPPPASLKEMDQRVLQKGLVTAVKGPNVAAAAAKEEANNMETDELSCDKKPSVKAVQDGKPKAVLTDKQIKEMAKNSANGGAAVGAFAQMGGQDACFWKGNEGDYDQDELDEKHVALGVMPLPPPSVDGSLSQPGAIYVPHALSGGEEDSTVASVRNDESSRVSHHSSEHQLRQSQQSTTDPNAVMPHAPFQEGEHDGDDDEDDEHTYNDPVSGEFLLKASLVVDQDRSVLEARLREQLREEMLQEAVEASAVVSVADFSAGSADSQPSGITLHSIAEGGPKDNKHKVSIPLLLIAMLLVMVGLIVGVVVGVGTSGAEEDLAIPLDEGTMVPTDAPTFQERFTTGPGTNLVRIRERGHVRCGVYASSDFNIEMCHAVALAVLDDPRKAEIVSISSFADLENRTVDFLSMHATHTMGRDVYEPKIEAPLRFTVPYHYTGLGFGGVPEFVECADQLETIQGNCRQLRVCVWAFGTHVQNLERVLQATFVVPVVEPEDFNNFFMEGTCNVIARDAIAHDVEELREAGYKGNFSVGRNIFSREPLALVSRGNDDSRFSDLLNVIVQLFYNAEARNFTKAQAIELLESPTVAEPTRQSALFALMVKVVAEFGNYGELYERTLQDVIPRDGLNLLHRQGDGGLMYYFPFGDLDARGPSPPPGSMLASVFERGHLVCGVIPRPGFAEFNDGSQSWSGFDIEFCRALNAAIHAGETETVEFVDVSADRYHMLKNGTVDVISGERVTLQADIDEDTTGSAFTFSTPTFHDGLGDSYALVTNQEDEQWSVFVHWIVMATIYAETEGVSQSTAASSMPTTNLFGQQLRLMFIDALAAVGNYGEIYERTLGALIPRSGGNLLNDDFSNPQVYEIPFH